MYVCMYVCMSHLYDTMREAESEEQRPPNRRFDSMIQLYIYTYIQYCMGTLNTTGSAITFPSDLDPQSQCTTFASRHEDLRTENKAKQNKQTRKASTYIHIHTYIHRDK